MDESRIEKILKGTTLWLTPKAVEGYDRSSYDEEFDFLPNGEKKILKQSIEKFLKVASQVPGNKPATMDQVQQALPEYLKIVQIFRPDKYADFDAFLIGKKIERLVADHLPEWVREMVFETGYDSSGAPALRIWVEVEDEAAEEATFYGSFSLLQSMLETLVNKIFPDRWPYIRVRTVSEQRPTGEQRPKARARRR